MSNLLYVHDEIFQRHLTPPAHPESPNRLKAIEETLKESAIIQQVDQASPRIATPDELSTVHDPAYIEDLERQGDRAKKEGTSLAVDTPPETFMSAESYDIAKLAAGAGLVALDAIIKGEHKTSFVAARPPGHHALADKPMGFCLFNNVAIAARYAQQKLGSKKVLIIDWDVHHGNGTQDLFFNDPSVCFVSFHQYPFWPPDSGWYTEDGTGDGKGYNINIPMPAGSADRGYIKAWDTIVTPIALEYEPDIIMLSAGYDAHQYDPLGQQQITTNGYYLLSNRLADIGEKTGAKVAGFLEGGYNTRTLAEAVATTMNVLNAGDADKRQSIKTFSGAYGGDVKPETVDTNVQEVDERIAVLKKHFASYWKSLKN